MRDDYAAQVVPYLVHSDTDKPHRCPNCWSCSAVYEQTGQFRRWHRYTCPDCGQQFASRPWLRWYPLYWHADYRFAYYFHDRLPLWRIRAWLTRRG